METVMLNYIQVILVRWFDFVFSFLFHMVIIKFWRLVSFYPDFTIKGAKNSHQHQLASKLQNITDLPKAVFLGVLSVCKANLL